MQATQVSRVNAAGITRASRAVPGSTKAVANVAAFSSKKSVKMAGRTGQVTKAQYYDGLTKNDKGEMITEGGVILPAGLYAPYTYKTERRKTRTVMVGDVPVGSEHPIALQTMVTADTAKVDDVVDEVMRCADAGAQIARITVQGRREAECCGKIRDKLFQKGYNIPLVADIHFNPQAASMVADAFEKIRINPGNFADGRKTFAEKNYSDEDAYKAELEYVEETFTPLVEKCRKLNRAMRIGTNHGSLSARILSYYGDSPAGMVESAFEFSRIAIANDYHNFLFSMKASNPIVMVQAYRLLAAEQYKLGWDYPLHLGVTEAGDGEDGRMKSAIGIGSLLMDGLGDTIRVSLTEAPELEMKPCSQLAGLGAAQIGKGIAEPVTEARDFADWSRRSGDLPVQRETDVVDYRNVLHRDGSVVTPVSAKDFASPGALFTLIGAKQAVGMPFRDIATSDSLLLRDLPAAEDEEARTAIRRLQEVGVGMIADAAELEANPVPNAIALKSLKAALADASLPACSQRMAITIDGTETAEELAKAASVDPIMVMLKIDNTVSRVHASRKVFAVFAEHNITLPVVHQLVFGEGEERDMVVIAGGTLGGALLCDGLGDGVCIDAPGKDIDFTRTTSFGMLQGSRMRNTKTEYVSCPSCGRTLFDLQEVTASIQEETGHLPGVTIAVMGCIVNGPGEMADADFGYVGSLPGKIDLYVGKEIVRKGIPNNEAVAALIDLIKEHDRWVDPEPAEEEAELVEA